MVVIKGKVQFEGKDPIFSWWDKWMEQRKVWKKEEGETTDALIEHGTGLYETWIAFAFKEPPDDLLGRIIWTIGLWGQLILSIATFPAALGAFLLEESVQTYGMGAYMLSTAGAYDILRGYLVGQDKYIDATRVGAKTLAGLSPITGGAVLKYLDAAKESTMAFIVSTEYRLLDELAREEKRSQLADEALLYGTLAIRSSPSNAEIWIDGDQTIKLTPETFKRLEIGIRTIELRKYSAHREAWDIYVFEARVAPGRITEIMIHIPEAVTGEEEDPGAKEEEDTPKLPDIIKAEVTGERAIDGDTFETITGERIRLLGIDAPETGMAWADMATEYLESKTTDKKVEISIQTHLPIDAYGRTLAMVYYRDQNLSVALVAAGLARVFIAEDARYDPTRLLAAEELAKARRIGIWSELP